MSSAAEKVLEDALALPEHERVALLDALANSIVGQADDELDPTPPDRARQLRRKSDGWPGSTSMHSGDCKED